MRTVLSVLCFFVAIPYFTFAQITLTPASYPASLIGTDSLKVTTYTSPFPSLSPATTATWDMSTVTDTTPVFYACRVPVVTYQYADSNQYQISTYGYQGNTPCTVTSLGLYEYGIAVKYSAYSLTTITLGPFDTL